MNVEVKTWLFGAEDAAEFPFRARNAGKRLDWGQRRLTPAAHTLDHHTGAPS